MDCPRYFHPCDYYIFSNYKVGELSILVVACWKGEIEIGGGGRRAGGIILMKRERVLLRGSGIFPRVIGTQVARLQAKKIAKSRWAC